MLTFYRHDFQLAFPFFFDAHMMHTSVKLGALPSYFTWPKLGPFSEIKFESFDMQKCPKYTSAAK